MSSANFQFLLDENRIGVFNIHVSHLFKAHTLEALRECFIVRAERMFRNGDVIEYEAFSQNFQSCPDGFEPFQYYFVLDASGKIRSLRTVPEHGLPSDWIPLWYPQLIVKNRRWL